MRQATEAEIAVRKKVIQFPNAKRTVCVREADGQLGYHHTHPAFPLSEHMEHYRSKGEVLWSLIRWGEPASYDHILMVAAINDEIAMEATTEARDLYKRFHDIATQAAFQAATEALRRG